MGQQECVARSRVSVSGHAQPSEPCLLVLLDGREDVNGRALLLASALHHCAGALQGLRLRFADVDEPSVRVAIELLRWDFGLDAWTITSAEVDALDGQLGLYASMVFRTAESPRMKSLRSARVPLLVAVQFPSGDRMTPEALVMLRAAHDPRLFAEHLTRRLHAA